jgi:VIT1/CCC1 family predicted Fe2+/Mn2+ transporter
MAEAEAGHRARLEQRLRQLGAEPPDPEEVKLSRWAALQARTAPVDRVLAMREAAEKDEVETGYGAPTGDEKTDALFAEIREDERAHSHNVAAVRSTDSSPTLATNPAQARLDRILGRESWHRTGAGWISGAIYGANDGLAAVFGIVAGVSGATGGSSFVLTAGLSGAVASALSMATGAFLAERSEAEVAAANLAQERREVEEHPEEEKEELSLYYQLKGVDPETADLIAERLATSPDALLSALAQEELGIGRSGQSPVQSAIAAGLSTGLGAILPVIPFFFATGTGAVIEAAVVSLVAHFLVGAAKSLVTLRSWWAAGLEMTLAGVIVGGATYVLGLALGASP